MRSSPGHRVAFRPPRDAIGKSAYHVNRDQQPQIPRRRRKILPWPGRLEDCCTVRHGHFAVPAVLIFSPVFDGRHAHFYLLFERRDRLLHCMQRIEWCGRHHVVHSVIEGFDAELGLFERKVAVLRIFRDFVVAQAPQDAVFSEHYGPEALESRAAERGVMRKQEIATPETFACNGPIGLRVNCEEDSGPAAGLRHAPHEYEGMPVWIGIDGAGTQRLLCQWHRIQIGIVAVQRRSCGSGMDTVGDGPQIATERGRQSRPLWSRFIRHRLLHARPSDAIWRLAVATARASRKAERQSHLECEIGAQEIRKVGAVGAIDQLHLVFAEAEIVEQEIARSIAQSHMQRRP